MRLIDADALVAKMNLAIAMLKRTMKNFDIEDDPECQMELKAYRDIRDGIKDEPTIEPQRWIPCRERLPEESGLYIVTNVGRCGELVETRYYYIREDGNFWGGHQSRKVLAWMPLPASYRKEGEE